MFEYRTLQDVHQWVLTNPDAMCPDLPIDIIDDEEAIAHAWFIATEESPIFEQTCCDWFLSHGIQQFAMSFEICLKSHKPTNGHHYHFYVYLRPSEYQNFIKYMNTNWFEGKLYGRSLKDKVKNYGKVLHIKDPLKMLAYTIKGNDFISTLPYDELEAAKDVSYEKPQDIKIECLQAMEKHDLEKEDLVYQVGSNTVIQWFDIFKFIIDYYRHRGKQASKHAIHSITLQYLHKIPNTTDHIINFMGLMPKLPSYNI